MPLDFQAQAELLRLCLDDSALACAMLDATLCHLAASRRYCELVGRSRETLLGQPDDASAAALLPWRDAQRACLDDGMQRDGAAAVPGDGARSFAWRVRPWHAIDGTVGGVVIFLDESKVREASGPAATSEEPIANDRLANKKLQASEARFSAFMDSTSLAAWIRDARRRYVYMNRAWAVQTGLNRDEWLGRPPVPMGTREHQEEDRRSDLEVLRHSRPSDTVVETISPAGLRQFWHRFKFPVRDLDGRPLVGIVSIDVTRQKLLELELHETIQRTQLIAEGGNVGLWDWNLLTNDVEFSPQWKRHLGFDDHEIPNRFGEMRARLHPADHARVVEAVDAHIAGRSCDFDVEFRLRHRDGSYRWILSKGKLLRDRSGRPARFMGAHVDVTDRKLAELSLQSALSQQKLITENIPALIVHIGTDLRLKFANRVAADWFGRPVSEIVGMPIDAFYTTERLAGAEDQIAAVLAGRKTRAEVKTRFGDGVERWCDFTQVPDSDAAGNVRGYFALGIDITERRLAEDRLRQAQRLEALGQLTGGIAHDFNNLLMVVLGNLDMVVARMAADDPHRRLVEAARRAAQRGADFNKRLLTFARRMPLRPQAVDINALVRDATELFVRTIGRNIEIAMELCPDPVWIAVDPGQMESALLNLVVNARDAMPAGGRLTLRTALHRGTVRLSVCDSGTGMSENTRARAFEPFFTTKPLGKGSGLGLSTVYGFVEQSGGTVAIDSAAGTGTTVHLAFPAVQAAPPGPAPDAAIAGPHVVHDRKPTALVVEDDPDVRDIVAAQLEGLGYTVRTVEDGPRAMLALDTAEIDVLVADVVLPGGHSGLGVVRAARVKLPRLRTICMSGFADDHAADLAQAAGMIYLAKPFTERQLAAALERADEIVESSR